MVNDTIADMLTRIRNANAMKYKTVEIPGTKMTKGIADILTKDGVPTPVIVKDSAKQIARCNHPEIWKKSAVSRI